MFGIQTAIIGLTNPLMAKVEDTFEKSTYAKLKPNPMPIFTPIPPLILREERDKPMIVKI